MSMNHPVFILNIMTSYHTYPKILTSPFYYLFLCLETAGWVANSMHLVQMPHSVAFDLDLHCLFRSVG